MVDLLSSEGWLIQVLYWVVLGGFSGWLYGATVRCRYSTRTGKAIGAGGALLALIGFDSSANAAFEFIRFGLGVVPENTDPDVWNRIHQVHGFTHIPVVVGIAMGLLGLAMVWGVSGRPALRHPIGKSPEKRIESDRTQTITPVDEGRRATTRISLQEHAVTNVFPAFATEYAEDKAIVPTVASCVHFLPAADDRRFPVRVTKRTVAGVKLPWYEVETYHANVARWVYRQSETDVDVAVDAADKTRLMHCSADEGDEEEDS
ncbi:hypothetical protein [Burkholderia stabilis]|uniref:hypothetical protein n=1 Tax=Burkholderia stabilis TaxID=95485 RepID=UPI001F4A7275|nr:hypothetical protein [Burkholderia stabilis]